MTVLLIAASMPGHSGTLAVTIDGGAGPVGEAVVSLHSAAAQAAAKPTTATIDQRDAQFVPRITVVTVGTLVRFPNSDDTRHQVYSFSPAKRFNLPLYHGTRSTPVQFDQTGLVELGCNIHDWMIAYVLVVDTPYYATTDAKGRAELVAPPGRYTLRVWHPHLARREAVESDVEIGAGRSSRSVTLALAPQVAVPVVGDEKLRALQEKFRKLKRAN